MKLGQRIRRAVLRQVLPPPIDGEHVVYSMIGSAVDEPSRPSERLLSLGLEAAAIAARSRLDVVTRAGQPIDRMNLWPGEHYRLLAGLVTLLKPSLIVEVGTGSGASAVAMKQALPPNGKIVTFDLIDWPHAPEGILRPEHFVDKRLEHSCDDVTSDDGWAKHRPLFERADLFFIDAAKDGVMEQRLIDRMRAAQRRAPAIVVFDDIRLWNMLRIWRQLPWPKLDLTSFGHWTGTGLAEWSGV